MDKEKYKGLALKLSGEIPEKVEYFEVNYEDFQDSFLENSEFDVLDYGVNLKMKSGKEFGFIWGSEFAQYGVSITESNLKSEVSKSRIADVTTSNNWKQFIGEKIIDVEVIWHWVKENGLFKPKRYYPQSVVLTFTNGDHIVLSTMEISESTYGGMSDNITVFFDKQTANKYKTL